MHLSFALTISYLNKKNLAYYSNNDSTSRPTNPATLKHET